MQIKLLSINLTSATKKLNADTCPLYFKKKEKNKYSDVKVFKQNIENSKIIPHTLNFDRIACPLCKKKVDSMDKMPIKSQQKKHSELCTCATPCKCNPPCIYHNNADKKKITRITPNDFPSSKILLLINKKIRKTREVKKQGAKITVFPKKLKNIDLGQSSVERKINLIQKSKSPKKIVKSCVCGNPICKKESIKKLVKLRPKLKKVTKPCICGSPMCSYDTRKMQSKPLSTVEKKNMKKTYKKKKKNKKEKLMEKLKNKEAQLRNEQYKREDEIRRKERKKRDKYMDAQIKKYKNTSDILLAAESILDIGRLGMSAGMNIIRCASRAVVNPKRTSEILKSSARDPSRILVNIKNALSDSGTASTWKRICARLRAMSHITAARNKLEQYAFTHFLLHAADKNPKRRLKHKNKRQEKKSKEPIDFACSLFMASLRKKPCLAVYYICPWFYPHCINFLTFWKQFMNIMLFLLAVTVWSPCILAMELCRAMMCCTFCTA
ncbi:uncharacterized protein LOC116413591 [Galleria mellonella]|uniref:Uncharacterized protein LOC116413591 n=1 Tax=Galleria mellonella TaxID=7137 RepID=A0A6J3C9S6_GALME|nr:uncharacterized protein LOC116413591 [Galleria mellonella]